MKNRIRKVFGRVYRDVIALFLNNRSIRKKYVLFFLLKYIDDYGIRAFIRASTRNVRSNRTLSLKQIRRGILLKIQKKEKERFMDLAPEIVVKDFEKMKREAREFSYRPKISFIIPTYNTSPGLLSMAIDSVFRQVYDNWEICIADDHSSQADTIASLHAYEKDARIKICFLAGNSGISEASNAAIRLAEGDYLALLDHDDEITGDALFEIVKSLNDQGPADILYSDECKINEKGELSDHFFKPDWSPELLFNMMYTGHLTVYRKDFLFNHVGLFRKEYDFSQDYDLMLRASEQTTGIRHIPQILYYWRITSGSAAQGDKPFARRTNLAALEDAIKRRQIAAQVLELPAANRVKIKIEPYPLVSIIIPTDSFANLHASLQSIRDNTGYPNYEIVVVTNSRLIGEMEVFPTLTILPVAYDKPYNFSDKCNCGAQKARGDILLFVNDDVRPLQSDWIGNTIEYLFVPGVGGVSPKLIYENDTIQYAGMATGVRNLTGTTFHCYPKDSLTYLSFPQLVRDVSILSGACLAMKKDLFMQIDGFDAVNTPSAHSDVDLSFKILDLGLRCVYTPYATLRHIGHLSLGEYEKKEKSLKKDKADLFLLKRWMKYLFEDRYFTQPMRDFLYHDSPAPFRLYPPKGPLLSGSGGDVLVVSHDLSLTGAPINLFDACKVMTDNGYFVVVCSPTDGPMRLRYQAAGIPVIVDALLLKQHESFYRFAKNFDRLFCNTIVTWPIVRQMKDAIDTIWWVQEARIIEQFVIDPDCEQTLREAPTLAVVSDYSLRFIRRYNPRATKIYNSCVDITGQIPVSILKPIRKRVVFSIIGSLEERKGQDILIDALSYLNAAELDKIELRLIGRPHNPYFVKDLKDKAGNKEYIRILGELSREECIRQIMDCDVMVSASRDEPFSLVAAEAFCLSKPCIISENTGIAELITDGVNGYIFKHEDPRHLALKLRAVLDHHSRLAEIGQAARKTYDEHLTIKIFGKKILDVLRPI